MNDKPREHGLCGECGAKRVPIQILDRGHMNMRVPGLAYANAGDRAPLLGTFPEAGHILAEACPECGEVRFYAQPPPRSEAKD